ncbi:MAG: hypothetical protein MHMPM18_002752 [Marteilia pararefringens]
MNDSICLTSRKEKSNEINEEKIKLLTNNRKFIFVAKNEGKSGGAKKPNIQGLCQIVKVCCGAKVMLTSNVNVSTGLVNGSTGTVKGFVIAGQPDTEFDEKKIVAIICYFPDYKGESKRI